MTAFIAVLKASFREAIDRKVVGIFVVIALLLAVVCAGFSFEGPDPVKQLRDQAGTIHQFRRSAGLFGNLLSKTNNAKYEVGEVRAPGPDDGFPHGLEDALAVELRFQGVTDIDELVASWQSFARENSFAAMHRREDRGENEEKAPPPPAGEAGRAEFLERRFADFGYSFTVARPIDDSGTAWRVAVRSDYPLELKGVKLGILFGAIETEVDEQSVAELLIGIEAGFANGFLSSIGVMVLLIVFAGFVPDMLHKGTLDLLLARPIGRVRLMLYRYLAMVLFVFSIIFVNIFVIFVGLSLRSGFWNPWFLLCSLTSTAVFAIIYPVAMYAGLLTRSAGMAVIITLASWFLSSIVVGVKNAVAMIAPGESDGGEKWKALLDAAYAIVPKTGEFDQLNVMFLGRSYLSPEAYDRVIKPMLVGDPQWGMVVGSSAGFAVLMLALTCWRFRARDW